MAKKLTTRFARTVAAIIIGTAISTAAGARTVVYVANADSREIYVLELNDKDGNLRLVEKVAVAGKVMPLAISPDRRYLYASLRSAPYSVSSFAIDQRSGRLTPVKTTALADDMAYIATDRTGRHLFGASYFGDKISVNAITAGGEVEVDRRQVIATGKHAHCILPDPSNKFLFVSTLGEDRLLQYRFDEIGGALTPNEPPSAPTKKGAGPRHFVFHPNRPFVYVVNELDGTLDTYLLARPSGALTRLASISVMPYGSKAKAWAADIRLTPNGKFVYATERTTNTVAAFRVDGERGRLTLIDHYATETQPRGINISPDGKYLLAAGQKSDAVSTHAIDQKTGELRVVSRTSVGKNPNWIEVVALPADDPLRR